MKENIEILISILTLASVIIGFALKITNSISDAERQRNHIFEKLSNNIADLSTRLTEIEIVTTRVELLNAIEEGYDIQVVSNIYDRYRKEGGNSYAEQRYRQYQLETKEENSDE